MRNFRSLEFMAELEESKMITVTLKNMTRPITVKVLFLYVVFFIYASIGQKIFGGEITMENVALKSPLSPPYYFLMNFNSFGGSIVTLFHFMIVNNWFITVNMYASVMGN